MQADDNSSEDWDADEQNETPTAPVAHKAKQTIRTEIYPPDIKGFDVTINNITCPAKFPRRKPNLDNYKPAVEFSAHLTNPPMEYKLHEILFQNVDVNNPTHIDKLINTSSRDPRLKKFLDNEKNLGFLPQREYSFFSAAENSQDPRLRGSCVKTCPAKNYNASPILYGYLQRSLWYQGLKSNLKIQINHSVSELVRALNAFHKETSPHKIFDFFKIECAGVLLEVMQSVGIHIDVKGNIIETANYHQLCAPNTKQHEPRSQQACNNNDNCYSVGGRPMKPGLLGYAPSEIMYSHPPMMHGNNENSFMRQAFGNDFVNYCNNGPPDSGFYVGEENFNRNRSGGGSNFEPDTYQRTPNQNIVRRM